MRFIVYLLTLFMVGTAVAQNPTILQGNYITNVFGQSNFVLNPNAQTNIANVTVSSATVTRSTTTPLVATSEFNITTSTSTGYADWATRTFDAGMKNQNCEARFTYRGFSVGSTTAQIHQGSNVVAQLVLTPSTDPRIASINFPCGDLSGATKFRLQQATASLTGTNEIGGIYVGLATNQANVAQAEAIGGYKITAQGTRPSTTSGTMGNLSGGTGTYVLFGKATSSDAASGSVTFSSLPAGNYMAVYTNHVNSAASTACQFEWYEDTSGISSGYQYTANDTSWSFVSGYFELSSAGSRTFRIRGKRSSGTNSCTIDNAVNAQITVYRFPTSSELVVTPERQNVWGGVSYVRSADAISVGGGSAAPTGYNIYSDSAWNTGKTYYGKCQATDSDANRIGCKIPNMPVGNYKITATGLFYEVAGNTGSVICSHAIYETTTANFISYTTNKQDYAAGGLIYNGRTLSGVFKNDSVADRNFVLAANKTQDTVSGTTSNCQLFVSNSGGDQSNFTFTITPIDQPSNSALYVQGPVKAAATGAAIPAGYLGKSEFGGDENAATVTNGVTTTLATYSNITPGVYLVRFYGAAQPAAPTRADYGFWTCSLSTNSAETVNWYDVVNAPSTKIGQGAYVSGSKDLIQHSMNLRLISITATSTYYIRCQASTNNSGIQIRTGTEWIRLN